MINDFESLVNATGGPMLIVGPHSEVMGIAQHTAARLEAQRRGHEGGVLRSCDISHIALPPLVCQSPHAAEPNYKTLLANIVDAWCKCSLVLQRDFETHLVGTPSNMSP